jgi:hypothetical protein
LNAAKRPTLVDRLEIDLLDTNDNRRASSNLLDDRIGARGWAETNTKV